MYNWAVRKCPKCHKNKMWIDFQANLWHCHKCGFEQENRMKFHDPIKLTIPKSF